jgi:hypothetical protein
VLMTPPKHDRRAIADKPIALENDLHPPLNPRPHAL